jgi:hypothetical protein
MKKIVKKKMGGTTKKYEDGGKVTRADIKNAQREAKLKRIEAGTEPSTYEKVANISGNVAKTAVAAGEAAKAVRDARAGTTGGSGMKKGGSVKKMKTGGMVNSNAKVSALKSAGSKGVKSGVNPKAAASKVAKGRSGGTSSAPKTAVPKAKYGMSMRKK